MRRIKKYILFLLISIICISSVHAISFEINTTPVKNKITIEEIAKFNLNIKNYLNKQQTFRIYTLDYPTWDIYTQPIVNPIELDVAPNSENSVELLVDPLTTKNIIEGPHFVNVRVKSKTTNEVLAIPLKVSVTSTSSLMGGYVPTVITNVIMPKKIDPREEIPIKIILNNQNIINYSELLIKMESNLISDEIKSTLGPKEEKSLIITKKLDSLTSPQKDNFKVTVLMGERIIVNTIVTPIEIIEYSSQDASGIQKKFFKTKKDILFYSNNKDYSGELKIETSLLKSLFSSTKPKAKILEEDNKRYFMWVVKLDENNSMKITIVENYRMLFLVMLLAIILVFVYYIYRSPLVIKKEAKNITKKEGGIFSLKAVLHIKNRSNKKIENIELREVIPNITHIEKDISIGTLKPTKILRHHKKGHIIRWDIDSLDIGEERVMSYKIKAKLPILGDLNLQAATAKFKYNNKHIKTNSNRVSISS